MREDFRNFRIDRIVSADVVEGRFGKRRAVLAREWEDQRRAEMEARYGDRPGN
jgi:predicted DNA-binding transcriptional regulator YafY